MYKALNLWLPAYLRRPRWKKPDGVTDVLLAVCDHFEPLHGADKKTALKRLGVWRRDFPKLIEPFRDSSGCKPRHTFFYPIEQYDPDILSALAGLCGLTGAEVEIHLHHKDDTADSLREKLERGKENLARHGLLSRDEAGKISYGFVHGNWALDNSHPTGRFCGVSNELGVLKQTGCFADFTMPSAPSKTQTRTINSLYYATDTPAPKSHDTGEPARVCSNLKLETSNSKLLLIQGPLGLNWERRKFGLLPKIENGDLTGVNPPRPDRIRVWTRLGIHVEGRPEWLFVKLHTHGGIPQNFQMLLGEPMRQFHQHLAENYSGKSGFRFHYVTAREMVNILLAAEDGKSGNAGEFRDYRFQLGNAAREG